MLALELQRYADRSDKRSFASQNLSALHYSSLRRLTGMGSRDWNAALNISTGLAEIICRPIAYLPVYAPCSPTAPGVPIPAPAPAPGAPAPAPGALAPAPGALAPGPAIGQFRAVAPASGGACTVAYIQVDTCQIVHSAGVSVLQHCRDKVQSGCAGSSKCQPGLVCVQQSDLLKS